MGCPTLFPRQLSQFMWCIGQGEGVFAERARRIADDTPSSTYVREMVAFILGTSGRSFLTPE